MTDGVANIDPLTVAGFGDEWSRFDQTGLPVEERQRLFDAYFAVFPWDEINPDAVGFDLGCGSGRWAALVAPRVGTLHCIDPSDAIEVARRNLAGSANVVLHRNGVDDLPLADGSMDFGYSLGVLHHVPDTADAIRTCVAKLKPGAPFLVYLYYAFDNRPAWFKLLWRVSELGRASVSKLPNGLRYLTSQAIAGSVYWPLARGARVARCVGLDVHAWPLSAYADASFYTMRTDALDRFGTRLEQRFSRKAIGSMLEAAGLMDVRFHDGVPYWCACGRKAG